MNLLSVALGVPEDKPPQPLKQSLENVAADVAAIFAGIPTMLCSSVSPLSKVRCVGSCSQQSPAPVSGWTARSDKWAAAHDSLVTTSARSYPTMVPPSATHVQ
jgi:hypothetical protein